MKFPLCILFAGILTSHAEDILFRDSFDRADSLNIDASLTGITDNTGSALAADAVYTHAWIDPNNAPPSYGTQDAVAGNGGGARILTNRLQLAVGAGTSNAFVNHNFVNPAIIAAGGFSVSLDVTGYTQTGYQQGGAFAIGMSQAEAASCTDAFNVNPAMSGAFSDLSTVGAAVLGGVRSDFWVALRGNNSLVWGGRTGTIQGVTGLAAKTGTVSVKFTFPSFTQGTQVNYQVFLNAVSRGSGSFVWSGTGKNFIGLDARDSGGVNLDNLNVSTIEPTPVAALAVSPDLVAADNSALPVTLTWTTSGLPAGSTYQITADKAVSFPSGGNAGSATNGTAMVAAVVDGTLGSTTFTFTVSDSTPAVIASATAKVTRIQPPSPRPNVIVFLMDDLGWADLGCFGSEIPTPNIDALAGGGVKFRQFYNSARCSPTRCSVLTGLYPQQAAVDPTNPLPDLRRDNNVTYAEMLQADGYRTYMAGKWHLGNGARLPENRGFQHVWRMSDGQANNTNQWNQSAYSLISQGNEIAFRDYSANSQQFYQTDAIGDYAVDFINHNLSKGDGKPVAMYLAFGAPHFPIQAPSALADTFMPVYSQGWDVVRQNRYNSMLTSGVIDARYPYPTLGGVGPHRAEPIVAIPAWNTLAADRQADLTRRMALYAAMIQKLDENVGKVVTRLQQTGQLKNSLIMLMSDNGGNHERGIFGTTTSGPLTGAALTNMGQPGQDDVIHYGGGWAHVSNTPLKLFKHFTHEGGIRAPLIVHWPAGFSAAGVWNETPTHLVDITATITAATQAPYPTTFNSHPVLPLEGINLIPAIQGQPVTERPLFVEHESNRMIRKGKWKLVTEAFTAFDDEFTAHQKLLYDMDADPGENTDVAAANPAKVVELVDEWNAWATRVGLPPGKLMVPAPVNRTPSPTPADLFLDTFDRPASNDIDSSSSGMSGSRVPPIGAGSAWLEGLEGSGAPDSTQLTENVLQMSTGLGMGESAVNHNFIGQDILDAGGFSVSLFVLDINRNGTDLANRFAGFGVGLNTAEAASGNDIGGITPRPIRGNIGNPGSADCFLELDLNGNVKLWVAGVLQATVPTGKTTGTLTASFACNSFASGATVTVSAYLDGALLDLDLLGSATTSTFNWNETDANHIAVSARAVNYVRMDNLAIRKLPLSSALATTYLLGKGLQPPDNVLGANPDGDRLDNFGEWAFGTDPTVSDDTVSATNLVLASPASNTFRFAHRRLSGHAAVGLHFIYAVSEDLQTWKSVTPSEETSAPLPASPGYEVVTLSLPALEVNGRSKLFVKIAAVP